MSLYIYNTLTKTKQEFEPITAGQIKMYVCGPTVYDYCHIGHGRAYIAFDIIYRYLRYKGYKVTYVRNITDIDDKIIARANKMALPGHSLMENVQTLTERYTKEFHTDMDSLNILRPEYEPRATEYIPQMIKFIKRLIEKGMAYQTGSNVYYETAKFKNYGILSGRSASELSNTSRIEPDTMKRGALDFSLWKEVKPQEPWWESPWGKGRPGWHIECSTMSMELLGETFDIHGGGQDLIFPHHENEIAQSFGYIGRQPVKYWIHNGFVSINKEKMSKSLGNFLTLRDIFKEYSPDIVRFSLLSQHYKSPIDFSRQLLDDARNAREHITDCIQRAEHCLNGKNLENDPKIKETLTAKFVQTMDDDFNTARALALVFDIVKLINMELKETNEKIKIYTQLNVLKEILNVLGIKYPITDIQRVNIKEELNITKTKLESLLQSTELDINTVTALIKARHYYRRTKQWKLSDRIRNYLAEHRYKLRDNAKGTECIELKSRE